MTVGVRFVHLFSLCSIIVVCVASFVFLTQNHYFDARIEADFTYVYPEESGRLQFISIDRGAWVDSKEFLFSLITLTSNQQKRVRHVYATKSAQVYEVYHKAGDWVSMNQPVLSLFSPEKMKVVFVSPNGSRRIYPNQVVKVKAGECKPWCLATVKKIESLPNYAMNRSASHRIEAHFNARDAKKIHPGEPVDIVLG